MLIPPKSRKANWSYGLFAGCKRKYRGPEGSFKSAPVQQSKHGYLIRLDDITWEIEPQVNLDSGYSVTEPARADFLLRQTSGPDDHV